jgi:hypothetical protein
MRPLVVKALLPLKVIVIVIDGGVESVLINRYYLVRNFTTVFGSKLDESILRKEKKKLCCV